MIVLFSEDLMMTSTVSAAARAAGQTFRSVRSNEKLVERLDNEAVEHVLIDLQTAAIDFDLIEKLCHGRTDGTPRMTGYAQHVNVDAIHRGREIGLDEVLTRGQLHGNVNTILARE